MRDAIERWESEGGAGVAAKQLTGTDSQVDWAVQIRLRVNAEFDRVANAFSVVANRQTGQARLDTESIIDILEGMRAEVMTEERAGRFIHDWQDIGDQVRQMIRRDSRYQAIQTRKAAAVECSRITA